MYNLPQKSVNLLAHINNDLGIDITKYKNGEVMGKVADLMLIQNYALSSMYKPILLSLAIYIFGFFVLSLEIVGFFVYGIVGLVGFFLIGLLYGIIKLLSCLKNDLLSITHFALDTTQLMISDFKTASNTVRDDIKNPIGLVFEGAIAAFVSPFVTTQCRRIPLAGNILLSGSDKILNGVVANLKKQENKYDFKSKFAGTTQRISERSSGVESFLSTFSSNVNRVVGTSFRLIQLPFRFALIGLICFMFIFMVCVSIF
ncbi:hypothetical protein H1R16_05565 [Marnyiella aurantia]|uniref:Uncharacterized protein n=1 Tax=Marnyiella aurantia TaxID=2758037 RepID=A0A7D7QV33_9FLAO|nr:hypothetical protein [Marnyiella aurantia]MBA5247844.1 hypothetical protein [Marnyiella aurantia]QMS99467.1 hypothetical protein H1R16_05565 [Marnyiella aurantia]